MILGSQLDEVDLAVKMQPKKRLCTRNHICTL